MAVCSALCCNDVEEPGRSVRSHTANVMPSDYVDVGSSEAVRRGVRLLHGSVKAGHMTAAPSSSRSPPSAGGGVFLSWCAALFHNPMHLFDGWTIMPDPEHGRVCACTSLRLSYNVTMIPLIAFHKRDIYVAPPS